MNDPIPYATSGPSASDASQLQLLSILYYVWGALVMLLSSIFIIHIVLGILMINNAAFFKPSTAFPSSATPFPGGTASAPPFATFSANNAPPIWFGYFMAVMGCCAVLIGWTFGILNILSGRRIAQRRSRVFTMVIAAINCISFPLGTALGVFTIIVLSKDSVKAVYFA
jgi:hypothetical protein